jgi:hypothetical protein
MQRIGPYILRKNFEGHAKVLGILVETSAVRIYDRCMDL